MSEQAVAVLVRAREMVRGGWCQGTGCIETANIVQRCAGQAIQDSDCELVGAPANFCMCGSCPGGEGEVYQTVMREFIDTIQDENIPHWNDVCGRTQEAVIQAFTTTIERLGGPPEVVPIGVAPIVIDPPKAGVKKVLELLGV